MKITYDPEVDALYIRFKETTVTTQHLTGEIDLDYDSDGRLEGIEILNCKKQFGDKDTFKKVIIEDLIFVGK
jgi:uncharacterized protein YuzE